MADRPRLLLLESLATIAGGQQVLLDLLPALSDCDLSAIVPATGPLAMSLNDAGVHCHVVPMTGYTLVHKNVADMARFPMDQIGLTVRCLTVARATGADLLYANSSRAFVWGTLAATLARRPIAWHVHNLLGDGKTLSLVRRLGHWPAVKRIVAVSRAAAAQFPQLNHKTTVVPTGVDVNRYHPDREVGLTTRKRLGIPERAHVVGMVGDLIPLKGQHTLLEAATSCPTDIWWVLAGAARAGDETSLGYSARLRSVAGVHVVFAGWVDDLSALLNALNLLVVASERETGPLVLYQALACGLPVISTPVGRAPELLRGEALFPVGDAPALAAKTRSWLEDENRLRAAGQEGRRLAESSLDVAIFRERMRGEIEACLLP